MAEIRMWAGAAGFALGLSLAGLGAAGVASADSDAAADTSRGETSAGQHRNASTVKTGPRRANASVAKAAAGKSLGVVGFRA